MALGDFILVNQFMRSFMPLVPRLCVSRDQGRDGQYRAALWGTGRNAFSGTCATDKALAVTEGRIRFADVGFAYALGNPVLKRFNMTIAGATVALVGASEAGKSTLSKLFRFYDPTEVTVEIDGTDIRSVSLIRYIAVVPQDCVLFNDTLRKYSLRAADATDERLRGY